MGCIDGFYTGALGFQFSGFRVQGFKVLVSRVFIFKKSVASLTQTLTNDVFAGLTLKEESLF